GSDGAFSDVSRSEGLYKATLQSLTFGVAPQDFDHDGRLDLAMANGHIEAQAEKTRDEPLRQLPLLFQRLPGGVLADIRAAGGEPFQHPYLGRALAWGDFDND